jgi:hypothetical protein
LPCWEKHQLRRSQKKRDAQGFTHNKKAAIQGGTVAGNARLELEEKSGKKVSIRENYKELPEIKRKLLRKGD